MDKKEERGPSYMELTVFASVGTQLAVSIFIGFGMGYWLDKWLNTRPAMMLVFTVLGVAAGFLNVYRTVRRGTDNGGSGQGNNR